MLSIPAPAHGPTAHLRVPASLSTLPTELKRMIVQQIADEDQKDFDAKRPHAAAMREEVCDVRMGLGMRAVSLVSTEFAALAQPYIWKALDLEIGARLCDLIYLIAVFVPRHGHHVKALRFCRKMSGFSGRATHGGSRWSDELALPHADAILGQPLARDGRDPVYPRQEDLLLARLISCLPELSKIRCNLEDFPERPQNLLGPAGSSAGQREALVEHDAVVQAIVALGDRLIDLGSFGRNQTSERKPSEIPTVLARLPSLSRLSLRFNGPIRQGRHHFITTLISLTHLTYLHIDDCNLVSTEFAAAPWTCPLERLSLTRAAKLSFRSFSKLLTHFPATLSTMSLVATNLTGKVSRRRKCLLALPQLHTLTLRFYHTSSLLQLFAFSPIRYLTLSDCQQLSWREWADFIRSHSATLRRVLIVGQGWGGREAPRMVRRMRRLCEAYGIEYEVERGIEDDAMATTSADNVDEDVEDPPEEVNASEESDTSEESADSGEEDEVDA